MHDLAAREVRSDECDRLCSGLASLIQPLISEEDISRRNVEWGIPPSREGQECNGYVMIYVYKVSKRGEQLLLSREQYPPTPPQRARGGQEASYPTAPV